MNEHHPDYRKVVWSCGFCGSPLNAHYQDIEPEAGYENYNPNDYPHAACNSCMNEAAMNDFMNDKAYWDRLWEESAQ